MSVRQWSVSFFLFLLLGLPVFAVPGTNPALERSEMATALMLREKAASLKKFARQRQMDESLFFILDMSISSGKNRFFVYDADKDSVLLKGLVTHGRCNQIFLAGRKYSNEQGSGCTSLGRYRVEGSYLGKFGTAYKLTGLDASNSNARSRAIVLHSHKDVPSYEIPCGEIVQSDGCPTVSPVFLKKLGQVLKNRTRPVLLYIFESPAEPALAYQ